jgi:hypothetical protein
MNSSVSAFLRDQWLLLAFHCIKNMDGHLKIVYMIVTSKTEINVLALTFNSRLGTNNYLLYSQSIKELKHFKLYNVLLT